MNNFKSSEARKAMTRRFWAMTTCVLIAAIFALAQNSLGFGSPAMEARERSNSDAAKKNSGKTDSASPQRKVQSTEENERQITAIEKAVMVETNKERSKAGLQPLELSAALGYLARGQSKNMCAKSALRHESESFPRGWRKFKERLSIVGARSGGENIAFRTASSETEKWAKKVVDGWMRSPPHRKNILTERYVYLGVGVAMCKDDLTYATQVFSSDAGRLP